MQKKQWALALGEWVVALGFTTGLAQAKLADGAAAQVVSLQGRGEQRAAEADPWRAAQAAQLLPGGAFVRTLDASKMALLFADDTQVRLNQNAMLQVKSIGTAQQPTSLLLSLGRVWAQTKRADGSRLQVQTPAATAGIRGTDWELDVDANGKTLLTVLSGSVEFSNAQGAVTVGHNEAALAEVGKAPVKIVLTNPRDRVQWVNALTADPRRHLASDAPAVLQSIAQWLQQGETALARRQLGALVDAPQGAPVAAYLMLSDVQLVAGETDAAINTLESGLQRQPRQPDLLAQLARVYLLADRLDDSAKVLARARDAETAAVLVAQGDLARRQGQAQATLQTYERATRVAPGDDRGWFGLGSALTEREDAAPARAKLQQALRINPQGPGYRGELGTLETYANRMAAAHEAFGQALEQNPGDFVAWTGQGLLYLKQGRPDAALDAFLRAGVLEPRYARAKAYTAVAYYQLGRHQDAIDTLEQAAALDDKDPVPYLFLSQVYTDLFRPGDAVQASRQAVARLPYLKSLNQVASDQKGSANFGAALAFAGMEDWAQEVAHQSYYPYWGASHLFLADRYAGEFNKNSELFQGFLSDPLAFGASNRYSSLLQRAGHFGAVEVMVDRQFPQFVLPQITLNGLGNTALPMAYFVQTTPGSVTTFPLDVAVWSGNPAMSDPSGTAEGGLRVNTLGLGMQPTERLGLFFYGNEFKFNLKGNNRVLLPYEVDPDKTTGTILDHLMRQSALGVSHRWSPTAQTWLKAATSLTQTTFGAYPSAFVTSNMAGLLSLYGQPEKRVEDIQLRHLFDASEQTRWSFGWEHVRERQYSLVAGTGPMAVATADQTAGDYIVFGGSNDINRRYTAANVAVQHRLLAHALMDASVTVSRVGEDIAGENAALLVLRNRINSNSLRTSTTTDHVTPRLGVAFKPSEQWGVRLAYQDWIRPLSVSTLGSVETAGIPLEDRLLEAGGRVRRSVAQVSWTPDAQSFLMARLDHQSINNPVSPGVDLRTPTMPFLESLRNAQTVSLSSLDPLEGSPSFQDGTLDAFTLAWNRMLSPNWSAYARYTLQNTDSSYADADAVGGRISGKRIPWVPRDTAMLGATWTTGLRSYLGARVVYRSERFEEKENATLWPAGWNLDLVGYWESQDKHWLLGWGWLNVGGSKSSRQTSRAVVDVRYRF